MNLARIFLRVGLTKFARRYLRRHLRKCSRIKSIVQARNRHLAKVKYVMVVGLRDDDESVEINLLEDP